MPVTGAFGAMASPQIHDARHTGLQTVVATSRHFVPAGGYVLERRSLRYLEDVSGVDLSVVKARPGELKDDVSGEVRLLTHPRRVRARKGIVLRLRKARAT